MQFNKKIREALFGQPAPSPAYSLDPAYEGLRHNVFQLKPEEIFLADFYPAQVWGVLMEMGFDKGAATLVALAYGTVSLYYTSGGGLLGLGPHPGPSGAAKRLIQEASNYVTLCRSVQDHPLPVPDSTQFYLFTPESTWFSQALTDELGSNQHPLSPLFYLGNSLISEIRRVSTQLGK